MHQAIEETLNTVRALCGRYQIGALEEFLESCQSFAQEKILNIAVLGRFKAGKSSFLNHLLGKALLPVGVIPVTTVVTEIQYGPEERALVRFLDGRTETAELRRIGEFISESENPENEKQVASVRVELPSMERYRRIRFVDTPGLESVLEHNTDASLEWLPNVGLALVAVGVDPPLSRHDIELIRSLNRYTPNISLLLTKVDVLDEGERAQVQAFVQKQLARYWDRSVPVFPYSTRAGFEELRSQLDRNLLSQIQAEPAEQRDIIFRHKLDSLLGECAGYLNLALKSAEIADSEREELRWKILGRKEAIDDTRLGLSLIVRHATGATRSTFERCVSRTKRPRCASGCRSAWRRSSLPGRAACSWRRSGSTTGSKRASPKKCGRFRRSTAASSSNRCSGSAGSSPSRFRISGTGCPSERSRRLVFLSGSRKWI